MEISQRHRPSHHRNFRHGRILVHRRVHGERTHDANASLQRTYRLRRLRRYMGPRNYSLGSHLLRSSLGTSLPHPN